MITHNEARIASMLTTVEASRIIIDYISQQEKVVELLGLYRHVYFHDKMMSEDEFYQTLYKIKEIEEELK